MTLQEKLEAFQQGTAVLHTPTQEIFSKLMEAMRDTGTIECILEDQQWWDCKEDTVVDYIYFFASAGFKAVTHSDSGWYREAFPRTPIIEVTEEDFNGSSLPAGIQKRMQEINGYTNDIVMCHVDADELLCDILEQQGFHEVVKWFKQLHGRVTND